MITETNDPALPNPVPGESLPKLLETHRRDTGELYAELRRLLAKEASVSTNPPPQAHTRRIQQLQKVFELYRQAEAKLELLVFHFNRHD
jgi:hypothetical protein